MATRIYCEVPDWFVEVAPELAAERDLKDGAWVRFSSRRGALEVRVVVTDRVQGNMLYMPIHHYKPGVNMLTGNHVDSDVNTPAYKECTVKLERLTKEGRPALHHNNYRYGHRVPTAGVEAHRKWARGLCRAARRGHRSGAHLMAEPIQHLFRATADRHGSRALQGRFKPRFELVRPLLITAITAQLNATRQFAERRDRNVD